jgi:hypothetical protein
MLSISMTVNTDWIDGFVEGAKALIECIQGSETDNLYPTIEERFRVIRAIEQGKVVTRPC